MITDNTSPLFWRCNCPENVIHFSDDDTCERCGASEAESPNANISLIQRFHPFIPVEMIPQQILEGVVFVGNETVHSYPDAQSRVDDAFVELRALIREKTYRLIIP